MNSQSHYISNTFPARALARVTYHTGNIPDGYSIAFESSLFNTEKHRMLQSESGWDSFHILHPDKQLVLASTHFHIDGDNARSPLRSPYGSVEASDSLQPEELFGFLEFIEEQLRSRGVKTIAIKCSPQAYNESLNAILFVFLGNMGYILENAEVSAVLNISQSSFADRLTAWGKQKLKAGKTASLTTRQFTRDEINEIYEFIQGCHAAKGYKLSMSLENLVRAYQAFDDRYMGVGALLKGQLVAGCIAIRVSNDIHYYFLANHQTQFDDISPTVMLIEHLYSYCQSEGIRLFDLGTSALEGKPNFGLLNFKLRLGARPTPKYTFSKVL